MAGGKASGARRPPPQTLLRGAGLAALVTAALAPLVPSGATEARAQETAGPAAAAKDAASKDPATQVIRIVLARELRDRLPPLSLLDQPPKDEGVGGARLAIDDNNTTGRFLK
ncbi:MAG: hypothetical protein AB7L18_01380, partial [Hyphomicrobiaceae bacterium]